MLHAGLSLAPLAVRLSHGARRHREAHYSPTSKTSRFVIQCISQTWSSHPMCDFTPFDSPLPFRCFYPRARPKNDL